MDFHLKICIFCDILNDTDNLDGVLENVIILHKFT